MSLAKSVHKQRLGSELLYPNKELEMSQEVFYPKDEEAVLKPLIKMETTDNGQDGEVPQVVIKQCCTQQPGWQTSRSSMAG